MAKHRIFILFVIAAVIPWVTAKISCYTCVTSEVDMTCLEDPDNVNVGSPVTECNKDCCTMYRQEYIEQKGVVASFSRGCQNNCPKEGVYKIEDAYFITYWTYCNTPLCNSGDGDDKAGVGGGGGGDGNIIDGILGVGGASSIYGSKGVSYSALLLPTILFFLVRP